MNNNDKCTSRNIPLPIQREVRQRCGFGCVICGLPLYEYEHMEEWALVKRHVADEITLLCDQHHKEKTNGLLPKEVVHQANKKPFNLQNGTSKPYNLHFFGEDMTVKIGTNIFSKKIRDDESFTSMVPVMVDGIPLLAFIIQDNHILINMNLFDRANNPLLKIVNNQLIYNVTTWDIQLTARTLTIREKARKILLELEFIPPNKIEIRKGSLFCNGIELKIDGDIVKVNDSTIFGGISFLCDIGIGIGDRCSGKGSIGLDLSVDRC
ncbi:cell division protein [Salmonella enterica]|nr:cell division protein [Salmonella enterica]